MVFVAIDLLDPTENIKQSLSTLVENVTHAFFTSYVHTANFDTLREKNIPLFANFIDALDELCPRLERVCLQTGGKVRPFTALIQSCMTPNYLYRIMAFILGLLNTP